MPGGATAAPCSQVRYFLRSTGELSLHRRSVAQAGKAAHEHRHTEVVVGWAREVMRQTLEGTQAHAGAVEHTSVCAEHCHMALLWCCCCCVAADTCATCCAPDSNLHDHPERVQQQHGPVQPQQGHSRHVAAAGLLAVLCVLGL